MNETDGMNQKVRIDARLNQMRGFFDCLREADVLHRNTQKLPTCLVVLHHPESETERIQRSRGDSIPADGVHIRHLSRMFHLRIRCLRGPIVAQNF